MSWETASSSAPYPWDEVGLFTGEVNVRTQVTNMLETRGHAVFVRKRTSRRCSCYRREQYDEPSKTCPYCDGYGWYYQDYEYKTRRRPAFGTFGFNPKANTMLADIMSGDCVFYFKWDNPITEAYRILEVTIDADGDAELPYQIERVHDIKLSHPYRDQYGRIEYWAALTREKVFGK